MWKNKGRTNQNFNPDRPIRKRVSKQESKLLDELRREIKQKGVDPSSTPYFWKKDKDLSIFVRNPEYEPQEIVKFREIFDDFIDRVKEHSPEYPKIKRKKYNRPHLMVIDPADIHIGKLSDSFETGEEYNQQIAVQRVHDGVDGLVHKAQHYDIEKILFIGGNDILHIDSPKKTTTSGTPQDTDGMWYRNFLTAKQLYVDILEKLITIADVHFMFCPSNHDFMSGFMLCQTIEAFFSKNKNITFDVSMRHRKYYVYGQNLLGATHGDGAKEKDLPLLMAHEEPQGWAKSKHRYIYQHHVHHKMAKDYMSVTVESMRSPSAADGWHHRNGYQFAPKAIESYLIDPLHGQVARFTHLF